MHGPHCGWIEYQLPDGALYYVYPMRRVIADLDLRDGDVLNSVNHYFTHHEYSGRAPEGMELWLRQGERDKHGFRPLRYYLVKHEQRTASLYKDHAYWDAGWNKNKGAIEDDRTCSESDFASDVWG